VSDLRILENDIIENGGEYKDGYDELSKLVKEKATSVASFLASKRLDDEIERMKSYKKEATEEVKKLKAKKEFLEQELNDYVQDYGLFEIHIPEKRYVLPDYSVTSEINPNLLGNDHHWEFRVKATDETFAILHQLLKEHLFEFDYKDVFLFVYEVSFLLLRCISFYQYLFDYILAL